jgi:signal transduction histidine kinase
VARKRPCPEDESVAARVGTSPPTRPVDAGLVGTGSGMGIANLRRRVELVGGTLHAAPTPDGGFCVEATLPAYVPTAAGHGPGS